MTDAVLSSRIIAEHPPVEVIDRRDDHTRIYEIARDIETTHPDSSITVDVVKTYIHEKASGLCYRDASGSYVPCIAEWRETPDGFVIDRCCYRLAMGKTIGTAARYTVEGNDLLLRPAYLILSDGINQAHLATLIPETPGSILPDNPSVLRFPSAFGQGYDLEYVAEKGGFHQNLIIARPPQLPDGFDPETSSIHLYTEINLDSYLSASRCEVTVEGEPVNTSATDLLSPPSRGGSISFHRAGRLVHAFCVSQVTDSSGPAALDRQTIAEKRLMKDPSTRAAYLIESIPLSYFTDRAAAYPVTWDYQSIQEPISGGTWEPRHTYWVTDNIYIQGTLIILPGTTVKLNPAKRINIVGGGKLTARGEPYNYITFTKASDRNCGEPIPGAPSGVWESVFCIWSGSSAESIIEYCKFGHGNTAIYLARTLLDGPEVRPIQHNIFQDTLCALYVDGCSATAHNNLMTYCSYFGIYVYEGVTVVFTNNTIDHTSEMAGIFDFGSSSFTSTDNLFSNCTTGIYTNTQSPDIRKNAYYNVSGGQFGSDPIYPTYSPYASSAIGDYFLNTDENAGALLRDAGSRTAEDAGLADALFAVSPPVTVSDEQYTNQQAWTQISHDTGQVDIGYHHCPTDVYLNSGLTVTGPSGVLTIEPGVVVGIRGDKYLKADYQGGKLLSVGDPSAGGLNILTCSKSLSMNIESPRFASTSTNPYVWVCSGASEDCKIEFTRTMWLGWGVWLLRDLNEPIRDSVFSLSYYGIHASINYCQNKLVNSLIYHNYYGAQLIGGTEGKAEVSNCTFDWNLTGLRAEVLIGGLLPIRDSLFTRNDDEGIWMDSGSGEIVNYYNAFWENGVPITGGSLGPGSLDDEDFAESPYAGPVESGWETCYKLNQDSPVVNGGSRSASYGGLSGYSTSITAERDVKNLDMGYHWATGQYADSDSDGMPDAWEAEHTCYNPGSDDDGDGLLNLDEYLHGTNPDASDTDDDGLTDDKEVMRGGGAGDWNFPRGPYLQFTWPDETLKVWVRWNSDGPAYTGTVRYWAEVPEFVFQYESDGGDTSAHEIDLTGQLPANTRIFYDIGTGTGDAYEADYGIRHFWTPPAGAADFSFIAYGDNRGPTRTDTAFQKDHARVVAGILAKCPDPRFVLHVGDLVYVAPPSVGQWDPHFFQPAQRLLEIAPVFPCLGNHEYNDANANFNEAMRQYFIDYFTLPNNERWYSFDYGDCHFVCLDTNQQGWFDEPGDDQRIWLSGDLENWSGKRVFVWFHQPPFSSGPHRGQHPGIDVRNILVDTFQEQAADMVFAGHDHTYERARNDEMNTVRYIVTGGGGAPLGEIDTGYTYPPAVREAWYAKNTPPGNEDAFQFCLVDVTTSAFNFKMYKWNGEGPKDEWP